MFFDKLLSLAFGVLFLLMLACSGSPSENEADTISVTRSLQRDPAFWDYAASSNMLQAEIGRLATEKAASPKIKALGQQAADFHSQALVSLRKLVAGESNLQLPDSLGGADKGLVQEFMLLEGNEFDVRYRNFIISSHRTQLDRYEEAIGRADDQETRDWLMHMRAHMRKALDTLAQPDSVAMPVQ
ncbi:DUF4142 domain-containing protein [Pontibacter sp. E15-1]|uniref:DUF4142 domain-containing protein n=1 Tax=Pontibacter sp. E15-1 TaxID=2919918 RepID=UPI001F4FDA62|nr:DUF4142 domain-containing protein [Pontibacter sp. E15-1]MCJ8165515.1 DUF4142 domain-containing protein [Pontibacter sp. E15-1]